MGEIYTGIELKLKAYGDNVEKLFCVKPGASPDQIKISLSGIQSPESPMIEKKQPSESPFIKGDLTKSPLEKGARGLWINDEGQLVAETELGPVKFTKPVAYQEINGRRVDVSVEYRVESSEAENKSSKHKTCNAKLLSTNPKSKTVNRKLEYGFKVASYDRTKNLIIDPLLASTFLGGTADEKSDYGYYSIAVDISGNVYVSGLTYSSDFPTTSGAFDTTWNGGSADVFVSKLNSGLTNLLASTYLGGSGNEGDFCYGDSLTLDTSGNVYVTGYTYSSDFPTTSGAYDTSWNDGNGDAFVSKLNSGLTSLLASTYLGGSNSETGNSITLDTSGNVYVMGGTGSSNFPTTGGAYDTSGGGVFVSKLDSGLTILLASTCLGGSRENVGHSLALDTSGNVYVTGYTYSSDFPTTSGAYNTSFNGGLADAFVSKLNSGLTSLLASTYLGGYGYDYGNSLILDTSGNVFVTGFTSSEHFPTTSGAYGTSYNGGSGDAFVSKLNSGLTSLLASTYLGGSVGEVGHSIALDTSGNAYVTGYTYSSDFPTTSGAYDTSYDGGNADVFVSMLDGNLSAGLPPTVTTGSATSVTSNSATLSGTVNANGLSTTAWFNYGITIGSYTGTSTTQSVSGSSNTSLSSDISGLSSNTTYYYRIAASNSAGTSYGSEASFTTSATPDTTAPTGSISINSGASYTNSTAVTLTLSATDAVGVVGYYLSTSSSTPTSSASGWNSVTSTTSYTGSVSYVLTSGDETKTVYAWYKDAAGNVSSTASDSIILDTSVVSTTTTSTTTSTTTTLQPTTTTTSSTTTTTDIPTTTTSSTTTTTTSTTTTTLPKGVIVGIVTDEATGAGIAEAKITADKGGYFATTGVDGTYTIADVTNGNYTLTASADGYNSSSQPVTVYTGEVTLVDFLLTRESKGIVFGFVNDQDEQSLEGVTVKIERVLLAALQGQNIPAQAASLNQQEVTIVGVNGGLPSQQTVTDVDGYYEFTGLEAGDYVITYEKEGFQSQTQGIRLEEDEAKDLGKVVLEQIERGKIYGYAVNIKGNPLEFVRLKLKGVKTKVINTASSDADGFFEFADLDADTYVIIAKKKGYRKTQQKVTLEAGESEEIEVIMRKTSKRVIEMMEDGQ